MSAEIHPTAVIDPGAKIGSECRVGPFCVIGPNVVLGEGCDVKPHAVIVGDTALGPQCTVFPGAVVGEVPQDLKYRGEATRLRVGARNTIREGVTLNIGTAGGGGLTTIGDDNLFMTGSHVGHDATIGSGCVFANQVAIAGHCEIGDRVIVGGLSGVHQWVRIGTGAIIGAVTMVTNDVIPYGLVQGPRGELDGLNIVGLKRSGTAREDISALRVAYAMLKQGDGSFIERARRLRDETSSSMVKEVCAFILTEETDRHFLVPR